MSIFRKHKIVVTPILAGTASFDPNAEKFDKLQRKLDFSQPPQAILYDGVAITSTVEASDYASQVVGMSMQSFDVTEGEIALWDTTFELDSLPKGQIVVLKVDAGGVDAGWRCLRMFDGIVGDKVKVLSSSEDGDVEELVSKEDVVGIVSAVVSEPQRSPRIPN